MTIDILPSSGMGEQHAEHGMPAPPQPQASSGSSHGLSGWFSQTMPESAHLSQITLPSCNSDEVGDDAAAAAAAWPTPNYGRSATRQAHQRQFELWGGDYRSPACVCERAVRAWPRRPAEGPFWEI